jgi:DNA-binding MarR family transcriptional regulator
MVDDAEVAQSLLAWAGNFMRFSLRDFNNYIRTAGLSFGQMTVLLHLHYQGPCEVSHFCELLQITPAGASQLIERLVQLGFVLRAEVPGDRRVRRVELSDSGRQVVHESILERQAWVAKLVKELSAGERELVLAAMRALNAHSGTLIEETD